MPSGRHRSLSIDSEHTHRHRQRDIRGGDPKYARDDVANKATRLQSPRSHGGPASARRSDRPPLRKIALAPTQVGWCSRRPDCGGLGSRLVQRGQNVGFLDGLPAKDQHNLGLRRDVLNLRDARAAIGNPLAMIDLSFPQTQKRFREPLIGRQALSRAGARDAELLHLPLQVGSLQPKSRRSSAGPRHHPVRLPKRAENVSPFTVGESRTVA
jgi:hypothetical protein